MKKLPYCASLSCSLVCAGLLAHAAHAQEIAAPLSEHQFSLNAALTSDYRYRGISQSRLSPALQGGADYVHAPSGLYAGTWLSSIEWTRDNGGGGTVEADFYAGKRGSFNDAFTYDLGVLSYVYLGNGLRHVNGFANANTTEVYGQLAYGPAYVKYSYALTDLFGFVDSRHSGYLDVGANIEAGQGIVINLHAGHQRVQNLSVSSYTDWKIGATRDFGFATLALAWVGTNAGKAAYASPANGKFLGRDTLLLTLSRTF